MKKKNKDKIEKCKNCGKEITINECETHKNGKEECYYCHLQKEHVEEYKEEVDKTPSAPVKKEIKDMTKKEIDKDKKSRFSELFDKKDKKSNSDDDKGLYT